MTQPGQRLSMQQWSAFLDRQTTAQLLRYITERGISRADVLREAVDWYLEDRARILLRAHRRRRALDATLAKLPEVNP